MVSFKALIASKTDEAKQNWRKVNGFLSPGEITKILSVYDLVTKDGMAHERFCDHAKLAEYISEKTGVEEYMVNRYLISYLQLTPEEVAYDERTQKKEVQKTNYITAA